MNLSTKAGNIESKRFGLTGKGNIKIENGDLKMDSLYID